MGYLDYGTSEGLAYRHNFQQDIANAQNLQQLHRQANIDAENKAKLFADEFKFGSATTDYNKSKLKGYTEQLIPQIGKFVSENQDYRTNPMKYAMYKQMTSNLLNNEWTKNDMMFQGNVKEFSKHLAKHPNDQFLPEVSDPTGKTLDMTKQIENYKKTGSIDGVEGHNIQFQFKTPAPPAKLSELGEKLAKSIDYTNTINSSGTTSTIEPSKVDDAVRGWLKDPVISHSLEMDRRTQSDNDKQLTDSDYAKKYFVTPSLKPNKFQYDPMALHRANKNYDQTLKKNDKLLESGNINILPDKYKEAVNSPTHSTDIDPEVAYKTQSSKTPFDGSNILFKDANGKVQKYNLGIIKGVASGTLHDIGGTPAFGYQITMPLEDLKNSKVPYDSDDEQFIHSTKMVGGQEVDMVTFPVMNPVNVKDKGTQANANSAVKVPLKKSAVYNKSKNGDTVTDPNTGDIWKLNADGTYTLVKHGG